MLRLIRSDVDILMITHRRPRYTELSLGRLLDGCDETMRVWVWHNGTDEETLRVVKSKLEHPRVHRFHHSPTNRGLTDPTNWLWENAQGRYVGKVDDDCLLPPDWGGRLRDAHEANPVFGVVGCWRFQDEDFVPKLARRKIASFRGGHRLLRNCWVEGSGYLMKRACITRLGTLRAEQSFTHYCLEVADAGWTNGWYYPFVRQEHMDDPRAPHTLLRTDQDLEDNLPLSARRSGVRTLSGWEEQLKRSARIVQAASTDPRDYLGWRRWPRTLVDEMLARRHAA